MMSKCECCGKTLDFSRGLYYSSENYDKCCIQTYRNRVWLYLSTMLDKIDWKLRLSHKGTTPDLNLYYLVNSRGNPTNFEFDNQYCKLKYLHGDNLSNIFGIGGKGDISVEVTLNNLSIDKYQPIIHTDSILEIPDSLIINTGFGIMRLG